MDTLKRVDTKTKIEETAPFREIASFRIKDLMLGELLCQSGILSDRDLLGAAKLARQTRGTLGAALVFSKVLSASELFVARRLVNRYLNDSDNPEQYVRAVRDLLHKQVKANSKTSLSLSKITRKHMPTGERLFLVS